MAPIQSSDRSAYVWRFPGSPVKIHLSLSAVTALESQLGTAGEGVLIGSAEAGSVEVTRSVAATARRPLAEILCDFEEHQIVGYYRIGRDEPLSLSAQDIE